MATEDSLNQAMGKAARRYASLFTLPTPRRMVLLLALMCIGGGLLSTIALFPSFVGVFAGFALGISLFVVNIGATYVVSTLVLKGDKIYDSRRTIAVSLFGWILWLFFLSLGVVAASFFGLIWWVRVCLLGFSTVVMFRLIVFSSTAIVRYGRLLLASLIQPSACIVPLLVTWVSFGNVLTLNVGFFFIFSLAVSVAASFFFMFFLNRVGNQTLGVPSISLFKAFMLSWTMDLNAPFEELLEKIGEERDVQVSLVRFDSSKPKVAFAIPSVHPGPFKNIGSSALPSLLKSALEQKLGCVACVPHGVFGHELDLASQFQNQKLIKHVVESTDCRVTEALATPFVTVTHGLATASCQAFGDHVLISFTLAPWTTEDLPQELATFVNSEVERLGFSGCTIVDAHNSIDGNANMQDCLGELKAAARTCLEEAMSRKCKPFRTGAASIMPEGFTVRDGMGTGGITVVLVEVGAQQTAYVVIDGNNMVSGLREKIFSALHSLDIENGEVFTTDTHTVSAVMVGEKGYNPVGMTIDHQKLIDCVTEAVLAARADLEQVETVCCSTVTVPKVKVIGAERLENLCLLVDRGLQVVKKAGVPVFATAGLVLMLFLMFV